MNIEKDPPNYSLENLPEELIEDILLRLPVKHLIQLKLVCKSWKSIISHPRFAKHHLLSSTTHHQFVSSIPGHSKIQIFSINSLLENPSNPSNLLNSDRNLIVGSCNGIVCLYDTYKWSLTLFNPSTGFTFSTPEDLVRCRIFSTFHGFGYDHVNDKYKLLLVKRVSRATVTEIYTFGENFSIRPRVVENSPLHPHRSAWLGRCVNGTLNWITPKISPNGSIKWVILSFNLANEIFGEVLLPGNSDNISKPMMNLVHNCLYVCLFNCHKYCWEVWMMKEYGVQDSWTKLMTTSQFLTYNWPCSCGVCIEQYPALEPLSVTEDGLALFKTSNSKLVVYNSKDDSYNRFEFVGDIWVYNESLVSPS